MTTHDSHEPDDLDELLRRTADVDTPVPDAAFVERLEGELRARHRPAARSLIALKVIVPTLAAAAALAIVALVAAPSDPAAVQDTGLADRQPAFPFQPPVTEDQQEDDLDDEDGADHGAADHGGSDDAVDTADAPDTDAPHSDAIDDSGPDGANGRDTDHAPPATAPRDTLPPEREPPGSTTTTPPPTASLPPSTSTTTTRPDDTSFEAGVEQQADGRIRVRWTRFDHRQLAGWRVRRIASAGDRVTSSVIYTSRDTAIRTTVDTPPDAAASVSYVAVAFDNAGDVLAEARTRTVRT